jgi:hypothetical protein
MSIESDYVGLRRAQSIDADVRPVEDIGGRPISQE